jgi:hypothetical protein
MNRLLGAPFCRLQSYCKPTGRGAHRIRGKVEKTLTLERKYKSKIVSAPHQASQSFAMHHFSQPGKMRGKNAPQIAARNSHFAW